MKKLTIDEFMELVNGKKWDVETLVPDFGLSVSIYGATVTMLEGNKISIDNNGCNFRIVDCNDTITEIIQGETMIAVNLFNLPNLIFTESIF